MKAISIKQPFASLILYGHKIYETRHWPTSFRGDLLICSSLKPFSNWSSVLEGSFSADLSDMWFYVNGYALCVVEVTNCYEFTHDMINGACCPWYKGYCWELSNLRKIWRFPLKSKGIRASQGFYNVDDSLLKFFD